MTRTTAVQVTLPVNCLEWADAKGRQIIKRAAEQLADECGNDEVIISLGNGIDAHGVRTDDHRADYGSTWTWAEGRMI